MSREASVGVLSERGMMSTSLVPTDRVSGGRRGDESPSPLSGANHPNRRIEDSGLWLHPWPSMDGGILESPPPKWMHHIMNKRVRGPSP